MGASSLPCWILILGVGKESPHIKTRCNASFEAPLYRTMSSLAEPSPGPLAGRALPVVDDQLYLCIRLAKPLTEST